ncbi:PREDICTED: probable sugar phosphate/phosphate translocator At4g32390 [Nelumbo nucifera]|uniref:Sugar phosphate transporter domain-containing protein n=2 Tax=Nelumbo nucifera TaxID=4432 RepID=A0A822YQG9_NELNU|nr:PREDICTED: probable sugar phosphate/phosphate translocator At4g32390 [Nelumbo nucifera]DAD34767.1 TPA_asm: hypothetical protein HUJ06_005407 [Nelumbo nucifera]
MSVTSDKLSSLINSIELSINPIPLSISIPARLQLQQPESPKMGLNSNTVDKVLLSYDHITIWIFLSFTVIIYNKYILDPELHNWPFPISLAMVHMSVCSILAFLLVRVFQLVDSVSMPRDIYVSSVMPIAALYSLSLCFSNSSYIYLSLSFIQMLKALLPVAVYSISISLNKEAFSSHVMANMIVVSVGVAIAAYGEAHFSTWGVYLQLSAIALEATRLVLTQALLTSKGINLNPITSLFYVAPCCLAFLSIPWFYVEFPLLTESSSLLLDFPILLSNSFCAAALNLAVFLLLAGESSALAMNVASVVKDWLLIAFSWL